MKNSKLERKTALEIMKSVIDYLKEAKTPVTANKIAKDLKLNKGSVLKYLEVLKEVTSHGKVEESLSGERITFWELIEETKRI